MEPQLKKLFIFGFGFSAQAIAAKAKPDFTEICGTARSEEKISRIRADSLGACLFDGEKFSEELKHHLVDTTHLLISIGPGEADPVLAIMRDQLSDLCPNLQWIGYLSTVGVYGNHDGAWVDEETKPKPVSQRSIWRMNAENGWTEKADNVYVPLGIFRLSGIYGPGRNAFVTIEKGNSRRLVKPGQVFNRIHREDIGTAVSNAMRGNIGGIFNITDNEPAPPQDVVTYAHELMGKEPPPEIDFKTADITPMARSFYGENKRVSNAKSKAMLGMDYAWPDYRTSLKRMWDEGNWH
ncbi:MAG: SDR family oxidoreductase [Pseudomonadota bacterium]